MIMTLTEKMARKSAPKSWVAEVRRMLADIERLSQDKEEYGLVIENQATENEALLAGLEQIIQWSEAYPLDVFPEPDFEKARKLLKDGGMTLDGISASNMRHVITEVAKIAKAALPEHLKG